MKRLFMVVSMLFLLTGCSLLMDTPTKKVEDYLDRYRNNDDAVKDDLETFLNDSNYSEMEKDDYRDLLLNQYKDLKYNVKEERIDGDNATVEVQVTVYDNYLVQKDADSYLALNPSSFDTNGVYDSSKFVKYKIDAMKNNKKTVEYNIMFSLTKKDDEWTLNQPSNLSLEKIHGIYNYEG